MSLWRCWCRRASAPWCEDGEHDPEKWIPVFGQDHAQGIWPMKKRHIIPGVDSKLLIKDAAKLLPNPARRAFLRGAGSLGALTLLSGCDIVDSDAAEGVLRTIS